MYRGPVSKWGGLDSPPHSVHVLSTSHVLPQTGISFPARQENFELYCICISPFSALHRRAPLFSSATHTGRPGALSILRHRALPLSAHLNALGHGRHHVPELVRSIGIQPMHSIPDPAPERLLPLPPTRLRRRQPAIEQRPRVLDGVKIRGIGGHCAPRGPESDGRKPAAGPPTPREGGRIPLRRTAELAPRVCGRRAPSLQPKRERYGTTDFSGTS